MQRKKLIRFKIWIEEIIKKVHQMNAILIFKQYIYTSSVLYDIQRNKKTFVTRIFRIYVKSNVYYNLEIYKV